MDETILYKVEMMGGMNKADPDARTFLGYAIGNLKDIKSYFRSKKTAEAEFGCSFEVSQIKVTNVTPELLQKVQGLEKKIKEASEELKNL